MIPLIAVILVIIGILMFGGSIFATNLNSIPPIIWIILLFFFGYLMIRRRR